VVLVLVEDGFVEFRCGVVDFFRAERGKDDACWNFYLIWWFA